MTTNEIEVLIGGGGNDTVTAGASSDTLMIAGGGGDDVVTIAYGSGEGTRILWGGEGADTFDFVYTGDYSDFGYQLGILVASVTGLTAANFASFTLDMLGLGAGFDWGAIEAVILNPGASDSVLIDGLVPEHQPYDFSATTSFDQDGFDVQGPVPGAQLDTSISGLSEALGAPLRIQSPDSDSNVAVSFREGQNFYTDLLDGMETGGEAIEDRLAEMEAAYGAPDVTWHIDFTNYGSGGADGGHGEGRFWLFEADADGNYDPDPYDSWFVAGGKFDGDYFVADGAPTAAMDDVQGIPAEWLLA